MDPHYMDKSERVPHKATLKKKKKKMMKVCSFLIDFGQFAKVLKRDRLGGEISSILFSEPKEPIHIDFCGRLKFSS